MNKDFFVIGVKVKDKNDYFVYDKKKGVLFYDVDGLGWGKVIEIMIFLKSFKMMVVDFFII